jgi:nucleoside-diphosphate-sugar epimerase
MDKILVTGATGFIGANLVRELLKTKNEIHVVIRNTSDLWRIKNIIKDCQVHKVDLNNFKLLRECIQNTRPQIVYHCATYGVSHSQIDHLQMFKTNVTGTINLLNSLAGQSGLECLINLGTSMEYGPKSGRIEEREREEPNTLYGISKLAQTNIVRHFAQKFNLPASTLRVFTSYGRFEEPHHLIGDLMMGVINKKPVKIKNSNAKRDFIFIDDVVRALQIAGEVKPEKQIINIGGGTEYSVDNIVKIVKKIGDIEIEDDKSDERSQGEGFASIKNAEKLLGWLPRTSINEGLKRTYEWFIKNSQQYSKN